MDYLLTFFKFAAIQFSNYLNITVNMRAIAHKQYYFAILTDAFACLFAWFIYRNLQEAKTIVGLLGMIAGGACSSAIGIWLTRKWDHKDAHQ